MTSLWLTTEPTRCHRGWHAPRKAGQTRQARDVALLRLADGLSEGLTLADGLTERDALAEGDTEAERLTLAEDEAGSGSTVTNEQTCSPLVAPVIENV